MDTKLETPLYNVVGERVALGPISREYLPIYRKWVNNFATLRTLAFTPRGVTEEFEQDWYERASKDGPEVAHFTIFEKATGRPVGNTEWNIDERHRTASLGIMIGEPDVRGQGFGTEAVRLMLDYAFVARGLHSAFLIVYAFNHAARRCYEKAGFKECGRRRECHQVAGKLYDVITMDCLASEFQSPVLAGVFAVEPEAGVG